MGRTEYVAKRLLQAIFVVFGVTIITFLISHVVPGDPAAKWVGAHPTLEQIKRARIELGLDKPIHEQYLKYVSDLFTGNWGISIRTHSSVLSDIAGALPASLELVVAAFAMAIVLGIPLGVLSAVKKDTAADHLSRVFAIGGVSIFLPWLAYMMLLLFSSYLGVLPFAGRIDSYVALQSPVQNVTGLYLLDTLITANWPAFLSSLQHIILPAAVLAAYPIGLITRMTRSMMIEVLQENYIRSAKAWGLPQRLILYRLALKNSIIPTLIALGMSFAYTLVGAFLVEIVFAWPGIGTYAAESFLGLDYPSIMGVTIVVALLYAMINLGVDLLQAFLDPRVTLK